MLAERVQAWALGWLHERHSLENGTWVLCVSYMWSTHVQLSALLW